MTDEQARLKEHFLEPETRDGYFIDAKMKAAWKEMLNITEEIVRICDKYGLNYSLAGGTLLGAVRHKGFIPWDDDVDLDMPREDYDKLLKVLPAELHAPYVLQTTLTDPGRLSTFAQVRNPKTTAIDTHWAKNKWRFNMGIGVDIFPIDGVPQTLTANVRTKLLMIFSADALQCGQCGFGCGLRQFVHRILAYTLRCLFGRKIWYKVREWNFAQNKMRKCKLCGEFSFRPFDPRGQWPTSCYDSYRIVPFEYLNLKIVSDYDSYLTAKYGDWRRPSKAGGYHSPLILDVNRLYKDVLVSEFGYRQDWVDCLP